MPLDTGGQIRFMTENLLATGLHSTTYSSEDVEYPYTNATSDFRSRPFKFTGRFEITTSNNKLYFYDGAEKTATIAAGEYTTRNLMATAIQTALNAVSANFTVVWNSTYNQFNITKTAAFILRLSNQTNAIWDTIGFVTIVDTASGTGFFAEETRWHYPYEFIKWDFGYFPEIGFFALIADSSKDMTISSMANVTLYANTIDDFTAPAITKIITRTDEGFFYFFDDDDYQYRFWKLTIEDNFAPEEIEIGNLYLGEFNKFQERYNDQGAISYGKDNSELRESESGQIYNFTKASQKMHENISIQMISPTDRDFLKSIFKRYGIGKPFYISIDPKLEINESISDSTFFCRFEDEPRFTHIVGDQYNTEFKLKEWL